MKYKIVNNYFIFFTIVSLSLINIPNLSEAKNNTTVWKLPTKKKVVALTFDDGPKPEESIALLNLLDQHGVRATFFITGRESESNPDLIMRINDSGHELANHSFSHPNLTTLSESEIEHQITKTNDIIIQLTGKKMRYFRPPGGRINNKVARIVEKTGMQTILYDVNTVDYTGGEQDSPSLDNILSKIKPGSIILLHNGGPQTLKNLPKLLEKLKEQNYECIRLSDILKKNDNKINRHHQPM